MKRFTALYFLTLLFIVSFNLTGQEIPGEIIKQSPNFYAGLISGIGFSDE